MQTRTEELFNASSHAVGTLLSIAALIIMIDLSSLAGHPLTIVSSAIYGASLVFMYAASTLYHIAVEPSLKKKLKIVDHSSIYFLIAGTYTPFMLVTLHGAWGWSLFGVVWGLALIGLVFKLFFTGRFEFISLTMYLLMGWIVLIAIKPLIHHLNFDGLMWLFAGGLFYTLGVVFYATDHKYKFNHFIWHIFVLAGSLYHFFAILFYVIL